MLLLTSLSYRPSWTPMVLLPPARYDPADQHPGSPQRSPTPKTECPRAERDWCKSGLTVHREIYQPKKHLVTLPFSQPKSNFYTSRTVDCASCKMLFSVTNVMLGKTNTSPLPTNVPPHQLANVFRLFFATKIEIIPNKLDSVRPTPMSTAATHVETLLVDFKPVSEGKILEVLKTCQPNSCDLDPLPIVARVH